MPFFVIRGHDYTGSLGFIGAGGTAYESYQAAEEAARRQDQDWRDRISQEYNDRPALGPWLIVESPTVEQALLRVITERGLDR